MITFSNSRGATNSQVPFSFRSSDHVTLTVLYAGGKLPVAPKIIRDFGRPDINANCMSSAGDPPVPDLIHHISRDGTRTDYEVREKIGAGGFATVYSALQLSDLRPVAIKCTSKKKFANPKVKRKLVIEIEIHKHLKHPNVVEFRGVFQDENYVYLLLELCPGGNVLEALKRDAPFNERRTADIVRQVLNALVYLRKVGVVHRDLKLQNFLIDGNGTVKLADFGLSMRVGSEDPDARPSVCGTPGYISPEVLSQTEKHTPAVDIWALGVCTFLMLTGKQPFQVEDRKETYRRVRHRIFEWPSRPALSEAARNFVESVWRRNPAKRPTPEALLEHPFITEPSGAAEDLMLSRSISFVVKSGESESGEGVVLPSYTVRMWWDYSSKYGLAYLLNNGVCGACFKDATRMVMSPCGSFVQYWDSPSATSFEVGYIEDMQKSPLRKKMLLMQYFSTELKQRVNESQMEVVCARDDPMTREPIGHVKYWARTSEGTLFRMANKDVQANFKDKTKVVIESATKKVYFDNGKTVTEMLLADFVDRDKFPELRKRFSLIKQMIRELI